MTPQQTIVGTFALGRLSAAHGTAIAKLIPPYSGAPSGGPTLFNLTPSGSGQKFLGGVVTHITTICVTSAGTAQDVVVMRPLNFTTLSAAAAANASSLSLTADPGVYSTNYNYPCPGSKPVTTGANAIASGDYLAVQLVDGSWFMTTASGSYTAGAVTIGTNIPNVTGGGAALGALVYWFGIQTDTDPATGYPHPTSEIAASQTRDKSWADTNGVVNALHPGDPMIVYVPNNDGAASSPLEFVSGFYAKY